MILVRLIIYNAYIIMIGYFSMIIIYNTHTHTHTLVWESVSTLEKGMIRSLQPSPQLLGKY